MQRSVRAASLGGALALGALLLAAPSPGSAVATLAEPSAADDVTAPLVALVSLLAWALAAWLALVVLLAVVAHAGGRSGSAAAALARRTAPVAVRRAVEVALGLSVTAGVLAGPAVAAEPLAGGSPEPPAASLAWASLDPASLDWGGAPTAPGLDWPAAPGGQDAVETSVQGAPLPAGDAAPEVVVVQPGDTLWELAEQHLAERDGAAPSDAGTAAAWPAWWQANREAVGDDPDLLLPGTPLTPPPDGTDR